MILFQVIRLSYDHGLSRNATFVSDWKLFNMHQTLVEKGLFCKGWKLLYGHKIVGMDGHSYKGFEFLYQIETLVSE